MKKLLIVFTCFVIITSCNNDNAADTGGTKGDTGTTPAPDGMVNSSAISTDTAAMRPGSTGKTSSADSIK